ncbi:MAG: hypothetical protein ACRD1K_06190 [Acidimicrobiales bacterium]
MKKYRPLLAACPKSGGRFQPAFCIHSSPSVTLTATRAQRASRSSPTASGGGRLGAA